MLPGWVLSNIDVIALLTVGMIAERHFVGRITTFSNAVAINLLFLRLIFVRRRWRNRGIAKAFISRSLRILNEHGMTEATLDVDTENPSGALRLYESLGFKPYSEFTYCRKQL